MGGSGRLEGLKEIQRGMEGRYGGRCEEREVLGGRREDSKKEVGQEGREDKWGGSVSWRN